MDNKEQYRILKEFIKTAELTNVKFAEIAKINKYSFQTMLRREYDMKQSTVTKILLAMKIIIDNSSGTLKNNLMALYKAFDSAMFMNSVESREALKRMLHELFPERADTEYTSSNVGSISEETSELTTQRIDDVEDAEREYQRVRMNAAFDRLNAEGQEAAADQVENLTYNPKYQKKESE